MNTSDTRTEQAGRAPNGWMHLPFGRKTAGAPDSRGYAALTHNYGCFVTGPHTDSNDYHRPGPKPVRRGLLNGLWLVVALFGVMKLGPGFLWNRPSADSQLPFSQLTMKGGRGVEPVLHQAYPLLEAAVHRDLSRELEDEPVRTAASLPPIWHDGMRFQYFPTIGQLGMVLYLAVPDEDGLAYAE